MKTFRDARIAAEVSLSRCAALAGVHRSTVASVQSGATKPKPETTIALARAVGADPREIVEFAPVIAKAGMEVAS